jgi:DNA (cytosine-5)-methyltransferase 1
METLHELALFAGAGGGILGGHLLGWRTVCAVERDPYAVGVLLARQNDGCLPPFPIWDDVSTFDGRPWRNRVDVVSGGFPCQDISAAGRGAGITGARSGLWGEMARIIREVGPRFVLVENSPMLTLRGLDVVLGDLAAMGFDAEWGVLGADDAGAPHIRKRIWIVASAHADRLRELQPEGSKPDERGRVGDVGEDVSDAMCERRDQGGARPGTSETARASDPAHRRGEGEDVADADLHVRRDVSGDERPRTEVDELGVGGPSLDHADGSGLQRAHEQPGDEGLWGDATGSSAGAVGWWAAEPDVGRVAHGVAARVDRLKCIGNGQVPSVAALAWRILRR